jgi:hypothetical protein
MLVLTTAKPCQDADRSVGIQIQPACHNAIQASPGHKQERERERRAFLVSFLTSKFLLILSSYHSTFMLTK